MNATPMSRENLVWTSQVTGKSGMLIVRAIVDGERDPLKLVRRHSKKMLKKGLTAFVQQISSR